jgi:hypothetical protein
MKKIITALLIGVACQAQAAWEVVHQANGGGTIYLETGTIEKGNGFLRAWIFTNYAGAINSDRVCYPSGNDCQWKRLNTMVQYDFGCNGAARLVVDKPEWDSGPTSQSYDPRGGYTIPEPRTHVPAPQPTPPGGTYNISNDESLLKVQAAVCRYK